MYLTAIKTESALKNIQAKTVKPKVKDICKNSLTVGRYFPLATVSRFFLLFLVNKIGKKYKAFNYCGMSIIKTEISIFVSKWKNI